MNEGWTKKEIRASDCVDYAFTYARREYKTLIPMLLFFHVPFVLAIRMMLNQTVLENLMYDVYDDAFAVFGLVALIFIGGFLMMLYYGIFIHVINGAFIYSSYRYTVFGDRPRLGKRLSRGFWLLLQNLIYSIIAGTAVFLVFMLIETGFSAIISGIVLNTNISDKDYAWIVAGLILILLAVTAVIIYFMLRFAYMPQFAVIQNKNVFAALGASWKATKGKVRRLFCIYFVGALVTAGISSAVTALEVLNMFTSNILVMIINAVLSVFAGLGAFLISIAVTFSYMHDMPETDALQNEMKIVSYLKEHDV